MTGKEGEAGGGTEKSEDSPQCSHTPRESGAASGRAGTPRLPPIRIRRQDTEKKSSLSGFVLVAAETRKELREELDSYKTSRDGVSGVAFLIPVDHRKRPHFLRPLTPRADRHVICPTQQTILEQVQYDEEQIRAHLSQQEDAQVDMQQAAQQTQVQQEQQEQTDIDRQETEQIGDQKQKTDRQRSASASETRRRQRSSSSQLKDTRQRKRRAPHSRARSSMASTPGPLTSASSEGNMDMDRAASAGAHRQ